MVLSIACPFLGHDKAISRTKWSGNGSNPRRQGTHILQTLSGPLSCGRSQPYSEKTDIFLPNGWTRGFLFLRVAAVGFYMSDKERAKEKNFGFKSQ
jgi:hypothetical protein